MKNKTKNFKLVFAGGGPFAEPIFAKLTEDFDNLTLISKEDKPKGRGGKLEKSSLKTLAESKNIPIFEPKNKIELKDIISQIKPDLVIVASLGIIITENTLKIPKYGFLNIHFSLLPLHRGPSPVQFTILNGDKKTGITIQKVVPEVDAGNIVYRQGVGLKGNETTETLGKKLSEIAAREISNVIHNYLGGEITPYIQDHSSATFTKIIKKPDGKIDWSESAEIIERKVRAYTPWPSAYTFWNGKMLKILEVKVLNQESDKKSGTFFEIDSGSGPGTGKLYSIQTGKGVLIVKKLQLEGKRAMITTEFVKGYRDIIGSKLGTT